jgi:hypothetical protein
MRLTLSVKLDFEKAHSIDVRILVAVLSNTHNTHTYVMCGCMYYACPHMHLCLPTHLEICDIERWQISWHHQPQISLLATETPKFTFTEGCILNPNDINTHETPPPPPPTKIISH